MSFNAADIKIRLFNWQDIEWVYHIETNTFPFPWPKERFGEFYLTNPKGFLVACFEGHVIGYIIARFEQDRRGLFRKVIRGHILNLAIEPRFKRNKVGTHLLKRILTQFERSGAEEVYLEVRQSNTEAIGFYSSFGFTSRKRLRNYYFNEDGVLMQLDLKGSSFDKIL